MLNSCQFIGNLGSDPETRTFQDGGEACNFRIACTEKWRDKASGEKREKTEWISIAAFGPLADIAGKYLRKGSKVFISGQFRTRKWQDKSGQDRYTSEIVLQGFDAKLVMLSSPQNGESNNSDGQGRDNSGYGQSQGGGYGGGVIDDDEIPF